MICPKCQHILYSDDTSCSHCGYVLTEDDLRSYDPYAPNPSGTSPKSLSGGVGDSITGLGNVICVVGIIASVIIGGSIVFNDDDFFLIGFLIIGLGCFLSWLSSLLLRGFGQLVSDTAIIRQLLQNRK